VAPDAVAPGVPASAASVPRDAEPARAAAREAERLAVLIQAQETAAQEAARQEAARQEAARQEAARQEAAWQEAARQEAARQEAARQEAARQEAARQEAARQEAARQEAARQESARQEAARQEAARQEAARQALAQQQTAAADAARAAEARREAVLRAIGRQLDDEADRRDVARATAQASPGLPPAASTLRRGRLFGRSDPHAALVLYAEAWARRIQLNMPIERLRELAAQPHHEPMVTVALRSDGTVESVTFVRSSGLPALDDAIRQVVEGMAPHPAFPPDLARVYDVIEIRRTWVFDSAIRLY
jgi:TonB family protein